MKELWLKDWECPWCLSHQETHSYLLYHYPISNLSQPSIDTNSHFLCLTVAILDNHFFEGYIIIVNLTRIHLRVPKRNDICEFCPLCDFVNLHSNSVAGHTEGLKRAAILLLLHHWFDKRWSKCPISFSLGTLQSILLRLTVMIYPSKKWLSRMAIVRHRNWLLVSIEGWLRLEMG